MSTIPTYLRIRCLQAFRFLRDAGWGYVLILAPFFLVSLFRLLELSRDGFPATALLVLALALSFQIQRGDRDFLSRLGPSPWLLRQLDYGMLALPLVPALLLVGATGDLPWLLGVVPIAALPSWGRRRSFWGTWSLRLLPREALEWRAGLRQRAWLLALLYGLGLLTARFVGSLLGLILLTALVVAGFYEELEGKDLLEAFLPHRGFLGCKLYWQAYCFHVLLLPAYLLFLYWHGPLWYLLLAAVLIAQSILCFSLFYKYSQWRPGQLRAYQQTALGLYVAGLVVPFLAPASLFYAWVFYRKARANIAYYYGDD